MNASEKHALAIYVVMARDWSDALEMVGECDDRECLQTLLEMLEEGTNNSAEDRELNEAFAPIVARRLTQCGAPDHPRYAFADKVLECLPREAVSRCAWCGKGDCSGGCTQ